MTDGRSRSAGGGEATANSDFTRRRFLKATAGTGAVAAGLGTGFVGDISAGITGFQELSVSDDNRIVDEDGETFVMRGVGVPDPKRADVTKRIRGKSIAQIIDLVTDDANGWYPRVLRVPASPVDIGEHPNGDSGEVYGFDSPPEIGDDRHKERPPQPVEQPDGSVGAFSRDELIDYLETYYDDVVERCKERGVYCIVDFHRHWHEQPAGDGQGNGGPEGEAGAENHLPYNSEYTNYWAKNTYYGDDGEDVPASWGWVDDTFRNSDEVQYFDSVQDVRVSSNHPYTSWEVNQDLVDEAVMFWDVVAERYADEPHVIFEPYSEPTAPGVWGPVEGGCGYFKQVPLWETYVEEFATPIMDSIRNHASEKLILMGVPGFGTSVQGLHWQDFEHDDVGVTYHNAAGHSVSREENWLNDTDYGGDPCNGWKPAESEGLQGVQAIRPVVVTEFGWQDTEYTQRNSAGGTEIPIWYRGVIPSRGTTDGYGEPFLDAMESDERISWVAWRADVRGETTTFGVDFTIAEKSLDLDDGNWYETPDSQIPVNCADLPCDWKLWENPNMGTHVKQRLAEKRNEDVPFETEETTEPDRPTWPDGATDPDGDGEFEDLNGNGNVDFDDVVTYFDNVDEAEMADNRQFYDYNGNDDIDFDDVVALFDDVE